MNCNQDYQRELALSLVEGCGVEDAIDFAQQNCWEGVLAQIFYLEKKGGVNDDGKRQAVNQR